MFISASLGILVKNEKTFYSVLFSQLILGLGLGLVGMYFCTKINYKFWRSYSFFILLKQPDTKSFILITATGVAMLFVSGVPVKYILGAILGLAFLFGTLVYFKPYLQERIKTFINPAQDSQGASYQIQQSLIALGSGGVFGRGFGQSVQKFSY